MSPALPGHPLRVALWTLKGVALAHVAFTHWASAAPGWGPSMLPTFLVDGEWFVVDRRCRRGRGVRVGDCVLYAIPVASASSPGGGGGGGEGVKRVMGLPGDYVLLNSPGARSAAMMQVPPGHCYITGDNLPWSRDSRDFGPLPLALVKGRVTHTIMTANAAAAASSGGPGSRSWWWPPSWFARVENSLVPVSEPPDASSSSSSALPLLPSSQQQQSPAASPEKR